MGSDFLQPLVLLPICKADRLHLVHQTRRRKLLGSIARSGTGSFAATVAAIVTTELAFALVYRPAARALYVDHGPELDIS